LDIPRQPTDSYSPSSFIAKGLDLSSSRNHKNTLHPLLMPFVERGEVPVTFCNCDIGPPIFDFPWWTGMVAGRSPFRLYDQLGVATWMPGLKTRSRRVVRCGEAYFSGARRDDRYRIGSDKVGQASLLHDQYKVNKVRTCFSSLFRLFDLMPLGCMSLIHLYSPL
jgi:hypothetical protein